MRDVTPNALVVIIFVFVVERKRVFSLEDEVLEFATQKILNVFLCKLRMQRVDAR